MRGEKQQEELQQLTRSNPIASARIIDSDGAIHFHIISTWWSRLVIAIILLLLMAVVILTVLVVVNKTQIDKLEQTSEEIQQHVNSSNTNR